MEAGISKYTCKYICKNTDTQHTYMMVGISVGYNARKIQSNT